MKKKVDDRLLEFIPQKRFDKLKKKEQDLILKHRRNFRLVKLKEQRIGTLQSQLKEQRELLNQLKETLTKSDGQVSHLRQNYSYNCSFIKMKPRPSGKQYCNISVSRSGNNPKGISMGNIETLRQHMIEYYKHDKKNLRRIKHNMVNWFKMECKTPQYQTEERIVYDRVGEFIFKNPIGFDNETINYNDLFPIIQNKKGK